MKWLSWFQTPSREILQAKEEARINRGVLSHKIIELEQQRHLLDAMVKRSLELLEHKK